MMGNIGVLSAIMLVFIVGVSCAQESAQGGRGNSAAAGGIIGVIGIIWAMMFAGFWLVWIGFMLLALGGLILWVMMLIDCAQRKFESENDKIVWILILVFTGFIGSILYYSRSLKYLNFDTNKKWLKQAIC